MEITSAAQDITLPRYALDWDKLKHPRDNAGEFSSKYPNGLKTDWKRRTTDKGAHVYEGSQTYMGKPMSKDNTPLLEQDPKTKKWTVASRDENCGHTFYSSKGQQFDNPQDAGGAWNEHISAYDNLSDHRKHLHAGGEDDGACAYDPGRPLTEQMQIADETDYGDKSWKPNLKYKVDDEKPQNDFGGTSNRETLHDGDPLPLHQHTPQEDDDYWSGKDLDEEADEDARQKSKSKPSYSPEDPRYYLSDDALDSLDPKKKHKHKPWGNSDLANPSYASLYSSYSGPVIPIYADAKQFPKSDFNSGDGEGHTCSRWNCNKPAHQYRSTGQGQMWACPEHAKEMKKD